MLKAITLALCSTAISFSAVVSNTNVTLLSGATAFPPYDYQLAINQFASFPDPTSIFFNRQGENLIYGTTNLDEGADWYFADFNALFNMATISQGSFQAFNSGGQSYHVGYGDFYLGVNTSPGFSSPETYRTIFGWALLRNSPLNGLQLLGSGVSYETPGIYVGTTIVPEVTTTSLLGISLLSFLFSRRRTKR